MRDLQVSRYLCPLMLTGQSRDVATARVDLPAALRPDPAGGQSQRRPVPIVHRAFVAGGLRMPTLSSTSYRRMSGWISPAWGTPGSTAGDRHGGACVRAWAMVAIYTTFQGVSPADAAVLIKRFGDRVCQDTLWVTHLPDSDGNMTSWRTRRHSPDRWRDRRSGSRPRRRSGFRTASASMLLVGRCTCKMTWNSQTGSAGASAGCRVLATSRHARRIWRATNRRSSARSATS